MSPLLLRILLVALPLSVAGSACKSGETSTDEAPSAPKPAEPVPVELETLGLTIDVPGGGETSEALLGTDGNEGETVSGDFGTLSVVVLPQPISESEAKARIDERVAIGARRDDAKPEKLATETLSDGFAMTFDVPLYRAADGERVGETHGVEVYRTIGGKTYRCYGSGLYDRHAPTYLAACKTLR